jgi:hypothetical protein
VLIAGCFNRFAYSITFATLVSAATDLAAFWSWDPMWQIPVYNVVVPLVLLAVNLMGVKVCQCPFIFITLERLTIQNSGMVSSKALPAA